MESVILYSIYTIQYPRFDVFMEIIVYFKGIVMRYHVVYILRDTT